MQLVVVATKNISVKHWKLYRNEEKRTPGENTGNQKNSPRKNRAECTSQSIESTLQYIRPTGEQTVEVSGGGAGLSASSGEWILGRQ